MADELSLSSNLEDYLETILLLEREVRVARAKDIAERMGVSRASVTGALKALAEKGLINYAPYQFITLTDQGKALGREVLYRHQVLTEFFHELLQLSPEHADEVACRVEHAMDGGSMEKLVKLLAFIRQCPRTGPDWLASFNDFCQGQPEAQRCQECVTRCLEETKSRP